MASPCGDRLHAGTLGGVAPLCGAWAGADDSNLIENAIQPTAVGKRNWLFVGHPTAGERSAVIYTLLGSCRRHRLNPFDYLKDWFTRLPAAKITEIKQFTPSAWARAKAKEKLVALAA